MSSRSSATSRRTATSTASRALGPGGKPDWATIIAAGRDAITAARSSSTPTTASPSRRPARHRAHHRRRRHGAVATVRWASPSSPAWKRPAGNCPAAPLLRRHRHARLHDPAYPGTHGRSLESVGRRVRHQRDPSARPNQANVVSTARAIDGQGGTLAFVLSHHGGGRRAAGLGLRPRRRGLFLEGEGGRSPNCLTHELGHSLGFQHGPSGQYDISPYLVPAYWKPQPTYDIPTGLQNYAPPCRPIPRFPPNRRRRSTSSRPRSSIPGSSDRPPCPGLRGPGPVPQAGRGPAHRP